MKSISVHTVATLGFLLIPLFDTFVECPDGHSADLIQLNYHRKHAQDGGPHLHEIQKNTHFSPFAHL